MRIAISTESTADLTKEIIKEYDFKIIPYVIQLGDNSGLDGEITTEQIISFVNEKKILPKTAAINEYRFNEYFTEILKEYDAIIHFSLSSELSVAGSNAKRAAENLNNVYVVDSRSLSTGIALLAIYAKKLVEQNLSAKEI
jgi:DegV family protein with EDD domain